MDFAQDLPALYADFGVMVTHIPQVGGAATGRAIFNKPGIVQLGGEMLASDYSLQYPAATFPAVKRGDAFTVGGVSYIAREHAQLLLDGLELVVFLAKA